MTAFLDTRKSGAVVHWKEKKSDINYSLTHDNSLTKILPLTVCMISFNLKAASLSNPDLFSRVMGFMILFTSVSVAIHHKRSVAWQLGIVALQWRGNFLFPLKRGLKE